MSKIHKKENLRNFATFVLVLFCIHYIPIEGRNHIGYVKIFTMAVCCCSLLCIPRFSMAWLTGGLYFIMMLLSALLNIETFRITTIMFFAGLLFTFVAFYNMVHYQHVFNLDFFLKLVRFTILLFVVVLVLQQICILMGVRYFPLLNMTYVLNRGIGSNSLTYEPSTCARMLGVLFYAYLKCNEFKLKRRLKLRELFCSAEHRRIVYGFSWAMLTMGSGTAFAVLAILSLYFVRLQYMGAVLPAFLFFFFFSSNIEIEGLQRFMKTSEAVATLDGDAVVEADGSAATRIKPVLNVLRLDFSKPETWLGHGIDYGKKIGIYSDKQLIAGIGEYGLIVYFCALLFVFSCAIKPVSIPTLMFFMGVGGGTANIGYLWGILMVFSVVNYFRINYENK